LEDRRHAARGVIVIEGAPGPTIRVIVADDDATIRTDLRRLLELEEDLEVVAVAHDGEHAVSQCQMLRPDVVVMDVRMPVLDGIAATRRIVGTDAQCHVLILTTFDLDDYVLGAIRAGAAGFLLKEQAPEVLAEAIRTVHRGEAILAPGATARLFAKLAAPSEPVAPVLDFLTRREQQVLTLIADGASNEDIASTLVVSLATVKTHVSNLFTKLDVTNRVQIVAWAYQHGVVRIGSRRA
jgi:DNA-binding NarL/FixJ family response regulator